LKGVSPPHAPDAILARLAQLGLPTEALTAAVRLKREGRKLTSQEAEALFERYLVEIQAAVDFIDRIRVSDDEGSPSPNR
jgi:hypothetical protein